MAGDVPATAVALAMAVATGTVGAAGITEAVATTEAATAIVRRPKVHDLEAAMVPALVAAGMVTPAVAEVAVDHVPALDPEAAATEEMGVSVVVVTADQVAATAK
jgi:hypothetical protein